jgi:hypothetical protein
LAGANISRTLAVIDADDRVVPHFLWAYLRHLAAAGSYETAGSTRASLNIGTLRKLAIPVPPRAQQEQIVEFIEQHAFPLAAGVADLQAAQTLLPAFDRSVLNSAFNGHPTVELSQVCEIRSGYGFRKDLQGRASGDIPFAKVRDISETWNAGDRYLQTANHYVSRQDLAGMRAKLFLAGTIVMAKIGEAVRLNRRTILGRDALVDNNVMGWVPDRSKISPEFLFFVSLAMPLAEISQATTIPAVRTSEVARLRIPRPSLEHQQELVASIESSRAASRELATHLARQLRETTRLERSILARAFSGKLSPLDAAASDAGRR